MRAMLALVVACHGAPHATAPDADDDAPADVAIDTPPGDDDAPFAGQRAACAFTAGTLTDATFGPSIVAEKIQIDVFVLMVH